MYRPITMTETGSKVRFITGQSNTEELKRSDQPLFSLNTLSLIINARLLNIILFICLVCIVSLWVMSDGTYNPRFSSKIFSSGSISNIDKQYLKSRTDSQNDKSRFLKKSTTTDVGIQPGSKDTSATSGLPQTTKKERLHPTSKTTGKTAESLANNQQKFKGQPSNTEPASVTSTTSAILSPKILKGSSANIQVATETSNASTAKADTSGQERKAKACGALGVSITSGMGIGNVLFLYATVYGVAKTSGRIPYVISGGETKFQKLFVQNLSLSTVAGKDAPKFQNKLREQELCTEDPKISNIKCDSAQNVHICCYLQSWKYFGKQLDDLTLRLKTFLPWVEKECQNGLLKAKTAFNVDTKKLLLYGIHVRMFDKYPNGPRQIKHGFPRDNKTFLAMAISHLKAEAQKEGKIAKFVAFSPDRTRLKTEFFPDKKQNDVKIADQRPWQVDFCMLTRLDGVIFTAGSFGWWAAAINGKTVIRQREFCIPGTVHCRHFNENGKDHYLNDKWLYF